MKNFNYKLQVTNYKPHTSHLSPLTSHLSPLTSHLSPLTLLLSYFLTVLLFNGCQKYPESQCPCGKIEISKKESIAMCIIPDIVTENSVNKLRIENYTKKNLMYSYYHFEYFHENNWIIIETDYFFDDMARYIAANTVKEEDMDLFYFVEKYNDSKKGKYRINKELGSNRFFAEFEVK